MARYQYRGTPYPKLVVCSNDFIAPSGLTHCFGIAVESICVWDILYFTPEDSCINLFPVEAVAQIFGNKFFIPINNRSSEPRTVTAGTIICKISPVLGFLGPIVYHYKF